MLEGKIKCEGEKTDYWGLNNRHRKRAKEENEGSRRK